MPAAHRVNTPKATAEDNKRFFLRESSTYKDATNIGKYCDCIALPIYIHFLLCYSGEIFIIWTLIYAIDHL